MCHVLSQTSCNICIMRTPLNHAILLDFYTFHRIFRRIIEGGNIPKHLLPPRLRRLLNSKVDLIAMPIATNFIHEGKEILLSLAAFQWSAAFSEPSIINLLLEHGAKVDEKIPVIEGTTLHLAISYGKEENVKCLLDAGADYSQTDYYNTRSFHFATGYGHLEILKVVYERGSHRYINQANGHSNVPIYIASIIGHGNVLKWLLQRGAKVNQPGINGATPLYLASAHGHIGIFRELLNNGADTHKMNDISYFPILIASENAQLEIFEILHDSGAFVSDVGAQDNGTCYHRVVCCSHESLSDHNGIIALLAGEGLDINQVNNADISPLYLACILQKLKHAQCLLKYGANINQMGPRGNGSPLIV